MLPPFSFLELNEFKKKSKVRAYFHKHDKHLGLVFQSTLPERVIIEDELANTLGSLGVDASSCQQHIKQPEHGDDREEPDAARGQHLHAALLSIHQNNGIRHLKQMK